MLILESNFKRKGLELIRERLSEFDLDFIDVQGARSFPDIIILGPRVWAALEFKRSEEANKQPNQGHHINRLNNKGYASFIFPENLEEVIHDLEKLFAS